MPLTLYCHPLSSFCWKALIALYEADIPFEARLVNLGDPVDKAAFQAVWPLGKMPVLRDEARGRTVPESLIIVEYLARVYPSAASLVPADPGLNHQVRLLDRLIDSYVHQPFSGIVNERLRPDDQHDPYPEEEVHGGGNAADDEQDDPDHRDDNPQGVITHDSGLLTQQ